MQLPQPEKSLIDEEDINPEEEETVAEEDNE
jgi:hypothetical protein